MQMMAPPPMQMNGPGMMNGPMPGMGMPGMGMPGMPPFMNDFYENIPRQEVLNITEIVKDACKNIFPNINLKVELVGDYRRGMEMCDGVDILITPPERPGSSGGAGEELAAI